MFINEKIYQIHQKQELLAKLNQKKPLKIKFGIDPTSSYIHLGHSVVLNLLKSFQDEGHIIQIVIGDFTALIGDPSGKNETRPILTMEEVTDNLKTYQDQIFKILTSNQVEFFRNSTWLNMSSFELFKIISKVTTAQILQRHDFKKRLASQTPLSLAEIIYPTLVSYDSVILESDVEVGGNDQLFNLMSGRDMQVAYGYTPQVVITCPLLEGINRSTEKMSKSLKNTIDINDPHFYGKLMSISDSKLKTYIETLGSSLAITNFDSFTGSHKMQLKQQFAFELLTKFQGLKEATKQSQDFHDGQWKFIAITFSGNSLVELIAQVLNYNLSNSQIRNLIQYQGVKINDELVDVNFSVNSLINNTYHKLKIGKKNKFMIKIS